MCEGFLDCDTRLTTSVQQQLFMILVPFINLILECSLKAHHLVIANADIAGCEGAELIHYLQKYIYCWYCDVLHPNTIIITFSMDTWHMIL